MSRPLNRLASISAQFLRPSPPRIITYLQSTTRTMASTSIPKTMKGVSVAKNGGLDVLEYKTDLPVPEIKDNEILVKNEFIGINYIDTYFRSGLYPTPSFPYTPGRETAGIIVKAGSKVAPSLKPGARVTGLSPATYAEFSAVPALHATVIPDSIDTETAGAALLQGLTALTLIRVAHRVNKGDWVLIHAAAGGMGLWLCQLLKAVGAHVIGTASTPEKRELAKKAGAEVLLEYPEKLGTDAFVAQVREHAGQDGVPVVFDSVGKSTFDVSLQCVARQGTMVSFGNASGSPEPFNIARLSAKNIRLMRSSLFGFITTREEFEKHTDELWKLMAEHNVDVKREVYKLEDVKQATADLEGRKTTGKLLLKP